MYFFGQLRWVAAIVVFAYFLEYVSELRALGMAVGAWFLVWGIGKAIVTINQERTARKQFEKQIAKATEKNEVQDNDH